MTSRIHKQKKKKNLDQDTIQWGKKRQVKMLINLKQSVQRNINSTHTVYSETALNLAQQSKFEKFTIS